MIGSSRGGFIAPGGSFPIILFVPEDGNVNMIFRTDRSDCSLAVLARRQTPPKLSAHDFLESLGTLVYYYYY